MKKLLIVTPNGFEPRYNLFPEFTLGRKLSMENKFDIIFATSYNKNYKIFSKYYDIPIYRLPYLFDGTRLISVILSLIMSLVLLLLLRPNILFVNHFRSGTHCLVLLAKLFRIKVILSEAGILHDEYITDDRDRPLSNKIKSKNIIYDYKTFKSHNGKFIDKIQNYLRHWKWYNADKILFYSKHNVQYAKLIGMDLNRIKIIRHYLNFDFLINEKTSQEIKNKYSSLNNKKVIFLICQLKKRKGYDIFLEVAKSICQKRSDTIFILASGSNNKGLIQSINKDININGLSEKIKILHKLSNEERNYLYKKCDIYLMPSRYEGFGLPAIEAGYNDSLIVASDVPALNEFLINEKNSLLFENENIEEAVVKVEKALSFNNKEKNAMKNNMIKTCKEFDINSEVYLSKYF
ncbi:glycosyltransferase [Arcobacter arenosus]|uniref:Glycosyltransferase family 4 protein n=1 Tax=Arcobacter arenosus TaxID=2576037 RepID=A0A5R8Y0P6_9BACT|nr:glycosyltransferase [Arcobacter arenosus]TLP37780.1 glycosyltransferase family 4 protein [Arcobacter arenosus]